MPQILWTSTKIHFLEFLFTLFDHIVRGLGPLLIILAIVLIGGCMYLYFNVVLPLKYPAQPPQNLFWNVVYLVDVLIAIYLSVCIAFHYFMAVLIPPGDVTRADAERWAALEEDLTEAGFDLEGPLGPNAGAPPSFPEPGKGKQVAKPKPWREAIGASSSSSSLSTNGRPGQSSSSQSAQNEPGSSVNLDLVLNADSLDELMPDSAMPRQNATDAFSSSTSRTGLSLFLDFKRLWAPAYSPAECPSYVRVGGFNKPFATPLDDIMGLGLTVGDVSVRTLRGMKYCKKCNMPKPSRAHHCSVCNKCVLKMDHHCPWIANCVGHHNHRNFVLFLIYMSFTCYYYALVSWPAFYSAINTVVTDNTIWPRPYLRSIMAFSWILAVIIGIAIVGLTWWQVFLVRTGLTTIDYYQWKDSQDAGKEHGIEVENFWDLGSWKRNVEWFFFVGKRRPWWTILIPMPVPQRTDGTWWPTIFDIRRAKQLPQEQ